MPDRVYYPDPNANVFRVGDILSLAGIQDYDSVQGNGAIILMELDWNCIRHRNDDR